MVILCQKRGGRVWGGIEVLKLIRYKNSKTCAKKGGFLQYSRFGGFFTKLHMGFSRGLGKTPITLGGVLCVFRVFPMDRGGILH